MEDDDAWIQYFDETAAEAYYINKNTGKRKLNQYLLISFLTSYLGSLDLPKGSRVVQADHEVAETRQPPYGSDGSSEKMDWIRCVQNVEDILVGLDMERYISVFKSEHIDLTALYFLSDKDLKDLGVKIGDRAKLDNVIGILRGDGSQEVSKPKSDASDHLFGKKRLYLDLSKVDENPIPDETLVDDKTKINAGIVEDEESSYESEDEEKENDSVKDKSNEIEASAATTTEDIEIHSEADVSELDSDSCEGNETKVVLEKSTFEINRAHRNSDTSEDNEMDTKTVGNVKADSSDSEYNSDTSEDNEMDTKTVGNVKADSSDSEYNSDTSEENETDTKIVGNVKADSSDSEYNSDTSEENEMDIKTVGNVKADSSDSENDSDTSEENEMDIKAAGNVKADSSDSENNSDISEENEMDIKTVGNVISETSDSENDSDTSKENEMDIKTAGNVKADCSDSENDSDTSEENEMDIKIAGDVKADSSDSENDSEQNDVERLLDQNDACDRIATNTENNSSDFSKDVSAFESSLKQVLALKLTRTHGQSVQTAAIHEPVCSKTEHEVQGYPNKHIFQGILSEMIQTKDIPMKNIKKKDSVADSNRNRELNPSMLVSAISNLKPTKMQEPDESPSSIRTAVLKVSPGQESSFKPSITFTVIHAAKKLLRPVQVTRKALAEDLLIKDPKSMAMAAAQAGKQRLVERESRMKIEESSSWSGIPENDEYTIPQVHHFELSNDNNVENIVLRESLDMGEYTVAQDNKNPSFESKPILKYGELIKISEIMTVAETSSGPPKIPCRPCVPPSRQPSKVMETKQSSNSRFLESAVFLQALARGILARSKLRTLASRAIQIQTFFRWVLRRSRSIQNWCRLEIMVQNQSNALSQLILAKRKVVQCSKVIQRWIRGIFSIQQTVRIQAWFRMLMKRYQCAQSNRISASAYTIQKCLRSFIGVKRIKSKMSASRIQNWIRTILSRRIKLLMQQKSIQSQFRSLKRMRQFENMCSATIIIQSFARKLKSRNQSIKARNKELDIEGDRCTDMLIAEELGISTEELGSLPSETYYLKRKEAAVALGYFSCAVNYSIEHSSAISGNYLDWSSFSRLKPRMEFAMRRGVVFRKYFDNMYVWFNPPLGVLHTSLTRIHRQDASHHDEFELQELGRATFQQIYSLMEHDSTTDIVAILSTGITYPVLRDEIYCQLLKQLSRNPSNVSKERGWRIMRLAISAFPPSDELHFFLHRFFVETGRVWCLKVMHACILAGPLIHCPNREYLLQVYQSLEERDVFWFDSLRQSVSMLHKSLGFPDARAEVTERPLCNEKMLDDFSLLDIEFQGSHEKEELLLETPTDFDSGYFLEASVEEIEMTSPRDVRMDEHQNLIRELAQVRQKLIEKEKNEEDLSRQLDLAIKKSAKMKQVLQALNSIHLRSSSINPLGQRFFNMDNSSEYLNPDAVGISSCETSVCEVANESLNLNECDTFDEDNTLTRHDISSSCDSYTEDFESESFSSDNLTVRSKLVSNDGILSDALVIKPFTDPGIVSDSEHGFSSYTDDFEADSNKSESESSIHEAIPFSNKQTSQYAGSKFESESESGCSDDSESFAKVVDSDIEETDESSEARLFLPQETKASIQLLNSSEVSISLAKPHGATSTSQAASEDLADSLEDVVQLNDLHHLKKLGHDFQYRRSPRKSTISDGYTSGWSGLGAESSLNHSSEEDSDDGSNLDVGPQIDFNEQVPDSSDSPSSSDSSSSSHSPSSSDSSSSSHSPSSSDSSSSSHSSSDSSSDSDDAKYPSCKRFYGRHSPNSEELSSEYPESSDSDSSECEVSEAPCENPLGEKLRVQILDKNHLMMVGVLAAIFSIFLFYMIEYLEI